MYAEVGRGAVEVGQFEGDRGRPDADVADVGRLGALTPEEDALRAAGGKKTRG